MLEDLKQVRDEEGHCWGRVLTGSSGGLGGGPARGGPGPAGWAPRVSGLPPGCMQGGCVGHQAGPPLLFGWESEAGKGRSSHPPTDGGNGVKENSLTCISENFSLGGSVHIAKEENEN